MIGFDLDHASQAATELGGNTGSAHRHGFEFIYAQALGEGRRTIVVERNAVNDVLHIIFGSARMQHAVGLQQPAGLRVHDIDHGTARRRTGARTKLVGTGKLGGTDGLGIEQGFRFVNQHRGLNRRDSQRNALHDRRFRPHFDTQALRRKPVPLHIDRINAKRKAR